MRKSRRRGTEIEFARLDLNEQLGSVRRSLPLNARQPEILPYVPEEYRTEQFFAFSIESPLSPNELRDLAETWILPQVLALDGVADAQLCERLPDGLEKLVTALQIEDDDTAQAFADKCTHGNLLSSIW